ncbi:hypothetical protein [Paenibacillus sp. sgz500958]|uniref:hypothetical protein n=1 Tax=Paenibacillus sp. sgz500958 TaxID=3242475 RepID=UPI0036D2A27E
MKNDFIDLMSVFTISELIGPVDQNQDFEEVVKKIESIFNPRNSDDFKMDSTKFCPVVSSGDRPKYVIWGLNPHADEGLNGYTWGQLAEYHVPSNIYDENNVFDEVLLGHYYRNIGSIVNGLENNGYVAWSEWNKGNNKQKKLKYLKMIENSPMAVIEMIPFASKKILTITNEKMHELLSIENRMDKYFHKLTHYILTKTEDNAWIICNGQNVCEAFLMMLNIENKKLEKVIDYKDDKGYSLYLMGGKRVLLFHDFLKRNNGKLNSNKQLSAMMYTVLTSLGIDATDIYNDTPGVIS